MRFAAFAVFLFLVAACLHAQTYNYYFGNLHAHTAFSDGNKDSAVTGVGKPDGSYAYAKLSNNFDFLGISEHNHYSAVGNPGFKLPHYQSGLSMATNANQDGTFVTMFGMEYGVSSNYYGHVIIYGFNQLIGWETNVGGQSGPNYDIYNAKADYDGLFRKVKNNPGAFAYLAHPYWTDFSTNGTSSTALANAPYNAAYDSAIVGMPLRSGNAFSTFTNYNDYSSGNYFDYYKKMLYIGYHLGIGYDHDNHYTNFGRSNGGRLVILAPTLSRATIYSAMRQMHFYGSDDSNVKVEFSTEGNIMGSIVSGSVYPTFNVVHNDPDGEMAAVINIWRGSSSNSGGSWADVVYSGNFNNTVTFYDETIQSGVEYYYFADIKQSDGQWIVTSPIWYTGVAPLGLSKKSRQDITVNCFPNPVSKNLSVSVSAQGNYHLTINDVAGRKVVEKYFEGNTVNIYLESVNPGIYLLEIKGDKNFYSKKLVVE